MEQGRVTERLRESEVKITTIRIRALGRVPNHLPGRVGVGHQLIQREHPLKRPQEHRHPIVMDRLLKPDSRSNESNE